MAVIEKRVRNGTQRWVVRYWTPDRKQRSKSFVRKVDAERYLIGVEASKHTGTYVDPQRSKVTVGEWASDWLAAQGHLKPSTFSRNRGVVTNYIVPRWSHTALADVSFKDVQHWISGLTVSPGSVRKIYLVFSQILALAVNDKRLPYNPASGVKLPARSVTEKRYLTAEELHRLADQTGEVRHQTLVLTLGYCGLRWGEAAGLRIGSLDLLRARLTVASTVTEVDGRLVEGTPKTHQSREVPIPRFLCSLLAEVTVGRPAGGFVFPSKAGTALRRRAWRRDVFDPAVGRAGIGRLTLHDLRHTAASLAVSVGANVKAVQKMLGHQSAAMTLDVYAGLFDDDLDGVAERLNGLADVSQMCHTGVSGAPVSVLKLGRIGV